MQTNCRTEPIRLSVAFSIPPPSSPAESVTNRRDNAEVHCLIDSEQESSTSHRRNYCARKEASKVGTSWTSCTHYRIVRSRVVVLRGKVSCIGFPSWEFLLYCIFYRTQVGKRRGENGMLDGLLSCPGFTQGVLKKGTVVRPEFEMSSEIRVFRDASFSFPSSSSLMRIGKHVQCSTTCLSP